MTRKRFLCSYNRIELIITYVCNMRCNNCDAMVPQAVTKDRMSVDQIRNFVEESIKNRVEWKHIRVLGGEPTLHKDIFEILNVLLEYKKDFSPNTRIQLVSNGYGDTVKKILEKIPTGIEIENSEKKSNIQPNFSPVNIAPKDVPEHKNSDFSKGCWIPALCGIALDMHGYYPCSAAAAIDRVFGYNLGKKSLPTNQGELEKNFHKFCSLCGHFNDAINQFAEEDIISDENKEKFEQVHKANFNRIQKDTHLTYQVYSETWNKALAKYRNKRPNLSKYPWIKHKVLIEE